LLSPEESLADLVERVCPRNRLPLLAALGPLPLQRLQQAIGMMNALRITADLFADYAGRIAVGVRTAHPPNRPAVQKLNL
jgi:hypothetical protein